MKSGGNRAPEAIGHSQNAPSDRFSASISNFPVLNELVQTFLSAFCHSVKDSVLDLGYPLIFYSVSELPVLPFFAATFRPVFGIAAHRTYPDGAVADTGRSRRHNSLSFPIRRTSRFAPRFCWLFIPCPPPSDPIGRVAPTVRQAWSHIPDAPSRTPTGK